MSQLVFVYGTLMQSWLKTHIRAPNADSLLVNIAQLFDLAEFLGEAKTAGYLFKVAHFPGLVTPLHDFATLAKTDHPEAIKGQSYVYGELYRLNESTFSQLIPLLDEYEECNPKVSQPPMYRRERLPVVLNNNAFSAWAYVYNWPLEGLPLIPSGRFTASFE